MLSDAEIVRRLRAIRLSPASERYARRAPSMNGIAVAAGINREHVHDIASGKARLGRRSREGLSKAFTELAQTHSLATRGTCGDTERVGAEPRPASDR